MISNKSFKKKKIKLASLLISMSIAYLLLLLLQPASKKNFNDAATFGAQTTTTRAFEVGLPIQCSDGMDAQECIHTIHSRNSDAVILWLGNSQLHAINQFKSGEVNSTTILSSLIKKDGVDLITFSAPNENLQEQLILFTYLRSRLPIKELILPVVFDDTREDRIRPEIGILAKNEAVIRHLSETQIGKVLIKKTSVNPTENNAGLNGSLQANSEKILNTIVSQYSQLWDFREEMRGEIFTWIYKFRNTIFNIKPITKRKKILGPYTENMESLDQILDDAKKNKIHVILYIAPILQGTEMPYYYDEYNVFKLKVHNLAKKNDASFLDLEKLIPPEYWGIKDTTSISSEGEIDFMHFRASGHKILATKLKEVIK